MILFSPLEQFQILPFYTFVYNNFDFSLTNAALINLIGFFGFGALLYFASSNKNSNIQSFFFIPVRSENYFPSLTVIASFILFSTVIGLIPYSFTITSHLPITFTLSFSIFIGLNIISYNRQGAHMFSSFLPANTTFFLALLLVPIEFIFYIAKPISLEVRLFINFIAGHCLLKFKNYFKYPFKVVTYIYGVGYQSNHYRFASVSTFFNNLITTSSFLITPPKSLGKISMISWFIEQCGESSIFFIVYILAEVFMLVIALLGFLFIYIIYKKDTFFVDEFLPHLKKLSPLRKLVLGSFTVFTAIPNKFWINVKIPFIFVFIISVIVYILGFIFPFFFLCYFIYLVFCFESFIFGLSYESSEDFRKWVNFLLFGTSDEPFAAKYFYWFWGNMWQQASKKAGPAIAAVAVVDAKLRQEIQTKTEYANQCTEQAANHAEKIFKEPNDIAKYHKARREEWVEENGVITRFIKTVEDWFW